MRDSESHPQFRKDYIADEVFGVIRGPLSFAFRTLDYVHSTRPYSYPPHRHETYELILPIEGRYKCVLEGCPMEIDPGGFVFSQPGEQHEDSYQPGSRFFALLYHIRTPDSALWRHRIVSPSSDPSMRARPFAEGSIAGGLLKLLTQDFFNQSGEGVFNSSVVVKSLCEPLFWSIASTLPQEMLSAEFKNCGQAERFRLELINCFEEALSTGFSSKRIAAKFGISVRSFEYRCKATLAVSPAYAFASMKIGKAVSMLDAGATVKEAASSLGFADQFHFSKVFKRHVGVPPSDLRAKRKQMLLRK